DVVLVEDRPEHPERGHGDVEAAIGRLFWYKLLIDLQRVVDGGPDGSADGLGGLTVPAAVPHLHADRGLDQLVRAGLGPAAGTILGSHGGCSPVKRGATIPTSSAARALDLHTMAGTPIGGRHAHRCHHPPMSEVISGVSRCWFSLFRNNGTITCAYSEI